MKTTFYVSAHWDDEAKVFYSESDIIGLHIETDSIEEFEKLVFSMAPEICIANHFKNADRKNWLSACIDRFRLFLNDSRYTPVIYFKGCESNQAKEQFVANYYRKVKALLIENGFTLKRNPRGSHEIWGNKSGLLASLPSNLKIRHTANKILKDAKIKQKV